MEWHESLRQLLSSGAHQPHGNEEAKNEERKQADAAHHYQQDVADLLVVDNAKPHRRSLLHESQSTVAETQVSPGSSINEDELSVLFEEVDLYEDDEDEPGAGGATGFHHSFPVTQLPSRSSRRRKRRIRQQQQQSARNSSMALLARSSWASTSDSMIDYNSLDDMLLREENAQTSSARINVFQPARRRSFEASLTEVIDMSEVTVEEEEEDDDAGEREASEMDSKPAAVDTPWDGT